MSYTLRNYRSSDATNVVMMLNTGRAEPCASVDNARNIRLIRYVPLSSNKVVIEDSLGKIVGYAYVADKESNFIFEVGGDVHPNHRNKGISSTLINWAQEESLKLSQNAPSGVKCALQVNIFESEQETINIFKQKGFIKIREWVHYDIYLQDAPIMPVMSDGLTIREFNVDDDEDWNLVGPVMKEAFKDHWGAYSLPPVENHEPEDDNNEKEIPEDLSFSNAQGYCFIAFIGNEVAGGILCNAKLVEFKNTGRVGSVFSHPKFRRRGVGRALMLSAFNAFYQSGMRRIILDTDSQSFSESSRFYTSLGMNIYRREFLYEKEIRAGQEIRRLEK
jgi:mycothiol synthase